MSPVLKGIKKISLFLISLYMLVLLLFYFFQDKLLFFPRPLHDAGARYDQNTIENIEIRNGDEGMLRGWLCRSGGQEKQKAVIYFGGNAEEVSGMIENAARLNDRSLVLVNYPGYGLSEGKPGEKQFFSAALNIYDQLISRDDIDAQEIVVMGRSIGTGVATYLVAKRKVKGVILISPYASMQKVAKYHYGFLPSGLLLKHKFESEKYAKEIHVPLLAIFGTYDAVVPATHSVDLINSWAGKTVFHEITGPDHNQLLNNDSAWKYINVFLEFRN